MHFVARLPAPLLAHLRFVVGPPHTLHPVKTWEELSEVVRTREVDVAVVDPRADGSLRIRDVQRMLTRCPTLPLVVYTSLTPETMRATVELAARGLRHVVLRGYDDDPRRFRDLLEQQPAYALGDALLSRLTVPLAELPVALAQAVVRLFESPTSFEDVEDLAVAAGMTRRHVSRALDRGGLASPRTVVIAARLVRAYHYMRDPSYFMEDVAQKMGYGSHRVFIRQVRELLGMTPTEVRDTIGPDELIDMLADVLTRRGALVPLGAALDDREVRDGSS